MREEESKFVQFYRIELKIGYKVVKTTLQYLNTWLNQLTTQEKFCNETNFEDEEESPPTSFGNWQQLIRGY